MKLRVEYLYDDEAKVWAFRVPGLHVVGGGDADRADAERHCLDAIGFALECLEAENVGPDSEVVEYDVRLTAS